MEHLRLASVVSLGVMVAACSASGGVHGAGSQTEDGGVGGSSSSSSSGAAGSSSGSGGGGSGGPTGVSGGSGVPGCSALPLTCGPGHDESCCASITVPGGTFQRGFDGVTHTDTGYPATVAAYQLDRFLVTVGRFRSFVTAVENGWQPAAGSGKHVHLNGGGGVNGGTEAGWDPAWNASLAHSRADWDQNLLCDPKLATWTSLPAGNEQLPINCVLWEEAYAFCTWDGGFLPTEAESDFAAAGGDEQRVYAWSHPASSTTIDCSCANFNPGPRPCSGSLNEVGSESPAGDGRWGHADLAGNVWEWILDYYASPYAVAQCSDCADLSSGGIRVIRGGTFYDGPEYMATSYRHDYSQTGHSPLFGVRCARPPR